MVYRKKYTEQCVYEEWDNWITIFNRVPPYYYVIHCINLWSSIKLDYKSEFRHCPIIIT